MEILKSFLSDGLATKGALALIVFFTLKGLFYLGLIGAAYLFVS